MQNGRSQDWLEQLRTAGTLDSTGGFTLNAERAHRLIEERLLEEPHYYALCLISGAFALGAERARVVYDTTRFDLTFDGPTLEEESLQDLAAARFRPDSSDAFRELTFGVLAALSLKPIRLVVETKEKDRCEGLRLVLNNRERRVEVSRHLDHGNRVAINFPKSLFSAWNRQPNAELVQVLKKRCSWTRQHLVVNGKPITDSIDFGPCIAWRRVSRRGEPSMRVKAPEAIVSEAVKGSYSGVLAVGCSGSAIHLVVNGVVYPFGRTPEFEGARAVVYCDGLRKDLSQSQLVQNEAFEELQQWVRDQFRGLARLLDEQWDQLELEQQQRAVPVLDKLAELESRAGHLSEAQRLYERLLRFRAQLSEATDPALLLNLSNLGTLYFLQDRHDQALEIFLAIAEDLQKVGRFPEARTYYERVLGLEAKVLENPAEMTLTALVGWLECYMAEGDWVSAHALAEVLVLRFEAAPLKEDIRSRLLLRLQSVCQNDPAVQLRGLQEWVGLAKEGRRGVPRCHRCQSRRVLADVPLTGWQLQGHDVRATVCSTCGHIELSAEDFAKLWSQRKPRE